MKQVTTLALVILLAVTLTSAKEVSKLVSDETTTNPEPECMPDEAYYCQEDSDCCSNYCKTEWFAGAALTHCEPYEPCRSNREECYENHQCCSGYCKRFLLKFYCAEESRST